MLIMDNPDATLLGGAGDVRTPSVMAEHQNQDVDTHLAQPVVDSTTSVDGDKTTTQSTGIERESNTETSPTQIEKADSSEVIQVG